MALMMEPTMYMIIALAEKADITYSLEAGDDEEAQTMSPDKQIETLQSGVNEFDKIRKQTIHI